MATATWTGHSIISSFSNEQDSVDRNSTSVVQPGSSMNPGTRYMLVKYALDDANNRKQVLGATQTVAASRGSWIGTGYSVKAGGSDKPLDLNVSYRSMGEPSFSYKIQSFEYQQTYANFVFSFSAHDIYRILTNGAVYEPANDVTASPASTISVILGDTVTKKIKSIFVNSRGYSPTSGYSYEVDRVSPNYFYITSENTSDYSVAKPALATCLFRYKAENAAEYTEVDLGTATEYTLEGNLIPAGSAMQFQFAITDSFGGSDTTPWQNAQVKSFAFYYLSPARGSFINRQKDTIFSATVPSDARLTKFLWRKKDSEITTEATVTGTSYTLPANSITDGDNYEYNWEAVDRYGVTWNLSNWAAFYTTDATPTAKTIAPNGTVVDADKENVFTWQHNISTGSLATASELQKSNDENEWTALTTVAGAVTEAVIPAGTFANGTWYWRVRTSNLDGVQSAWSESAQFLAVATPSTPAITLADSSPRPTVVWQTNEQEAWEITIDGESSTSYGTNKTWKCPNYLDDGEHLVTVRVQSSYGRWSEHASAIFIVTNTPGEEISLSVLTGGASAVLTWTATGYDFFVVYRDGVAIAKVSEKSYVDYFSSGKCSYRVRGCYDDSNNYGLSTTVEAEVHSDSPVIIDAETHELLWLELSEQQHRTFSHTLSRQAASYHVTGRALPSVDITEFRDESLSLSCAFWEGDTDAQRRLESMIGRTVCLKTGTGEHAIGALTAVSKSVQMFYTTYQLSVTNSDYEEEVTL